MTRILVIVALVLGLVSCQPDVAPPGASAAPTVPVQPSDEPGRLSPSIEVPPPVN
jgi:hypothetical protein